MFLFGQVLAAAGAVVCVSVTPPLRNLVRVIRDSSRVLGTATLVSTIFIFALVLTSLLLAALERRASGASPLESLPLVGPLLVPFSRRQRMAVLLITVSYAAIAWNLLVRMAATRVTGRTRRSMSMAMWLSWVLLSVLSTLLGSNRLGSTTLTSYLAALSSLVAVILSARFVDREVLIRLLTLAFGIATAATYATMWLSHDWAWTYMWPGGFLRQERLQGIFPQPNTAGAFFGFGILIVLARTGISRKAKAVLAASMTPLVYWSGSRGAIFLLLAGGFGLIWGQMRLRRVRAVAFACAAATTILPAAYLNSRGGLLGGRAATWRQAYEIGLRSPIFGAGSFPLRSNHALSDAIYAHNQLLYTFAESGVLGLMVLSAAIWFLFSPDVLRHRPSRAVLLGMMASFPQENPIRIFAPSFTISLLVFLAVIGSSVEAIVTAPDSPEPAVPPQAILSHV